MTLDWQDLIALIVAAIACGYLALRGYATLTRRKANCGGCANCPSAAAADSKTVVSIEMPRRQQARG
jgi:hypothetical protein